MSPQPIIYQKEMQIRFSDLDPYNHVNAANYLNLVATSRLFFLEQDLNTPLSTFTKKGIGWYLKSSKIDYLRPIVGIGSILCKSHVKEHSDGILKILFEITSVDGSTIYSKGELDYVTVDLATGKKRDAIDLTNYLFFK